MFKRLLRLLSPEMKRNHLFCAETGGGLSEDLSASESGIIAIFPFPKDRVTSEVLADIGLDINALEFRWERGDILGVIMDGERVVHRSLVQTRGTAAMEGDPKAIPLRSDQRYVHWSETAAGWRGRGLYPMMLKAIVHSASQDSSIKEILIACRQNNRASVRGILKAGFSYKRSSLALNVVGGLLRYSHWYSDPAMEMNGVKQTDAEGNSQ